MQEAPAGDVLIDFDVAAEMRDGTVLRADVFRPARDVEAALATLGVEVPGTAGLS